MTRKLLLIPLGLLIAIVVSLLVLPLLVNANDFRGTVTSAIAESTGYQASFEGDLSIRFFPSARIKAYDVVISARPDKPFAKAGTMEVGVRVLPLLTGQVMVDRITINDPVITLVKEGKGNNWDVPRSVIQRSKPLKKKAPSKLGDKIPAYTVEEEAQKQQEEDDKALVASQNSLVVNVVEVQKGALTYTDQTSGKKIVLKDLDLKLALGAPSLKLESVWNGKPISLVAEADRLDGVSDVTARFKSELLNAELDGSMVDAASFNGNISMKSASMLQAVNWLSGTEGGSSAAVPVTFVSKADCRASACSFNDITLVARDDRLTGSISVDAGASRPSVAADLKAGRFDLGAWLPQEKKAAGLSLISAAMAADARWSSKPIDLSFLKALDLKLQFSADELVKDALSMKKVSLAADIKNGEVNAVLGSDELYSGSGSATLMGGADTKWNSNLTLAGVQVGQLLQALNGSSQISGAANIKAMVSASGNNEAELIGTLSGGGELSLAGGELRGVDLLAMAGGAKALINREATVGSTEFDQATATFTIDRGVISNDDLMVRSGGSSISGKGKLDLPNWRIDYRAIPNLAAGKGAPGVAVPVLITGPLDAPNYTPDAAGIVNNVLADPKAAKEGAKQLRDAVKDNLKDSKGSLKELLKGL